MGPRATMLLFGLATLFACGDDSALGGGGSTSNGPSDGGGGSTTNAPMGGETSDGGGVSTGGGGEGGSGAMQFSSEGDSSFEAQTHLAADADGNIVVVWVSLFEGGGSSIGYAISRDGGGDWSAPAYVAAPDGRLSSNPVVAVDGEGVFTLAWLGFTLDFEEPDEHIYVARLAPGEDTFSAPVSASDDGTATNTDFDKPSIDVDAAGDILLTWADFTNFNGGDPAQLTFARSSDGGESFTTSLIVNDAGFGNLAQLCLDRTAGANPPLYVVHLGAGGTLTLRKSEDGGGEWDLLPALPATNVVFQAPTCVVSGSEVSIVYGEGAGLFDPSHDVPADSVRIMRSSNAGTSFSQPDIVAPSGDTQYLFPRVAISPNGKLEVVYYEGAVGDDAALMHASSANGSQWTQSEIGTAGVFTTDLALASWLGGYVGLAIPGSLGFVSYTQNIRGKAHISFSIVALP